MQTSTTAVCPNTDETLDPIRFIPTDWHDTKPPVIMCPACGEPHQWRPSKGLLVNTTVTLKK